ncbi:RadC family protein [Spongiibacter tropicus]|uniref:RadC family protein n=1 Tax=Spongiibacter tropicus TaxID=454602 RepID=UPI0003B65E87|nr:DNA repair protein RadC [Spongiibacter tropicus]
MPISIPNFALCEATGKYQARRALTEDQIIKAAKRLLDGRVCRGATITSSAMVKDYLTAQFAKYPSEAFICLFLDSQHRLLKSEVMFTGTIDSAAVYPREVVRRCLELNAAAVIFAHNHPSGTTKPSFADKRITQRLKEALALIDARALDHIIVGAGKTLSFADAGLI